MTLLSMCQDAADEIGINRPTSVVGSSQPEAQKLFRYANKVGNQLMKVVAWQVLRAEQTFTSLAAELQTAIIPDDFDRFVPETFWDRSAGVLISGPISATEWQSLKATSYSDTNNPKFIYRGGVVRILPALGAGNTLAFEYVSNEWAVATDGTTTKALFSVDTDNTRLDSELHTYGIIYEYLNGEGLPAAIAQAAYEARFNMMMENDQPDAGIMLSADIFGGGRHFSGTPAVNGASSLL